MIRREPFLRKVQPLIHKAITATTGVRLKHALLAIGNLAQVAAILMGHANLVFPLLGKATTVYDRHAVAFSQPGSH